MRSLFALGPPLRLFERGGLTLFDVRRLAVHGGSLRVLVARAGHRVAYVADSTTWKQGRLTPGKRIPIRPEESIRAERPDYTLLLAWNYADAIVARFRDYLEAGSRFIHPIPMARVIPA